jgi:hypothetical protein
MIYLFTSATKSYLPKVRVLSASLKKYHPEMSFIIGMADEVPENFSPVDFGANEVVTVEQLGMSRGWIFQHKVVELSTAIKPFIFQRLLKLNDCEAVVYFDPDISLYSRLDDLFGEFQNNSILLIPHLTNPDVWHVPENELVALQFGTYNLGFLGVKNDKHGNQLIDWWANRLERYCFDDRGKGIFTDQKWADLVPGMFDNVMILRSSRFNVASWNSPTRTISRVGDTILVDGNPIGFYHFTGFDSGAHDIALNKGVGPDNPLWDLVKQYKKDIQEGKGAGWAYDHFSNGERISDEHRRLYRDKQDMQRKFPDPFDVDNSQSYYAWFRTHGKSALSPRAITCDRIVKGLKLLAANPKQGISLIRSYWKMIRTN